MTKEFEQVINLYIGSLISADSNLTNEDRESNIERLKKMLNTYEIDKTTLLDYQVDCIKKGIEILKKEIKENK